MNDIASDDLYLEREKMVEDSTCRLQLKFLIVDSQSGILTFFQSLHFPAYKIFFDAEKFFLIQYSLFF
jgi:hypothetical protein